MTLHCTFHVEMNPTPSALPRILLAFSRRRLKVQALQYFDLDEARPAELQVDDLLRRMVEGGLLKPVHEVVLFYECRCDDEMILEMITSLPTGQREELWGSETSLTIECPRCGREYTIQRS